MAELVDERRAKVLVLHDLYPACEREVCRYYGGLTRSRETDGLRASRPPPCQSRHNLHPSLKGVGLRVTFLWAIFAFLGYYLGYYLLKMPPARLQKAFLRRERDSNSRYPFGVHTLSRRASSATRASLQYVSGAFRSKPDCKGSKKIRKSHKTVKILWDFPNDL